MRNIIIIICLLSFNTCTCQNKSENKFIVYQNELLQIFPTYTCDFFIENNKYPTSKIMFEEYLEKRADGIVVLDLISSMSYGFQVSPDQKKIYIYDWGMDNEDDELRVAYTLDGKGPKNAEGDLLLFTINHDECLQRKRNLNSAIRFYSGSKEIFNGVDSVSKRLKSIIGDYALSLRENKDAVYVPKEGEESKKRSVLSGKLAGGWWRIEIEETEHKLNELNELIVVLTTQIKELDTLFEECNIDQFILPVDYYDNQQLEEL